MAGKTRLITKKCFPDATRVTDRFHVQKKPHMPCKKLESVPSHRPRKRSYMTKAKKSNQNFESKALTNGYTLKQLLARSRYFLYKNKQIKMVTKSNRMCSLIV